MTSAIVNEIHALGPEVPVYDIATTSACIGLLARQRFSMTMLGAFAGFALNLAMIGIYRVISYPVTQSARNNGNSPSARRAAGPHSRHGNPARHAPGGGYSNRPRGRGAF